MPVRTAYIEKLEKGKPNGRCRKWRLWLRLDDGRKRSKRFQGSYREAQAALQDFRDEVDAEVPNADTFGGYSQRWMDYRRDAGELDPGTLRNDAQYVGILCRHVGDMRMDAITPDVCRTTLVEIRNGRASKPLSGTYMNKLYTTFHAIMRQAHGDGVIARDPLANVPAPKVDTTEKPWMTPERFAEFVGNLHARPLDARVVACLLIAYLGLRRGEACALHVEDVDFDAGIVHVRRAVKERNGRIGDTKSDAGTRDLPMPDALADVLREWVGIRERRGYSSKVLCCSIRDTVMRPQNLYKWWESEKASLGAEDMTLHQIRHSNLSMMARHMSVFDLQRWAGWSSIEPARVYVHADAESLKSGSEDAFRHHFGTTKENRPAD